MSRSAQEKRFVWFARATRRGRTICRKNNDGLGSAREKEERQAKSTKGRQNQVGHQRERHATRAARSRTELCGGDSPNTSTPHYMG